jgi:hypothetical protein
MGFNAYYDARGDVMTRCLLKSAMLLVLGLVLGQLAQAGDAVLFRENFQTLDDWEPLYFHGIARHTRYAVKRQGDSHVLEATSNDSASALVCKRTFDIRDYPILHWRWKVDHLYAGGNYRRKDGDDYPLRIYVMFAYEPAKASLVTRLQYALARAIYGRYPPQSSLDYIWANRADATERVHSPYTRRSVMIPVEHGPRKVGQWVDETVNVLADYRAAFGGDPPPQAALAVMNDADNTGEGSTSYIAFIEVRK